MLRRLIMIFFVGLVIVMSGQAWAGEASFFDLENKWIIRAYTEGNVSPYSVSIEVRRTDGSLVEGNDVFSIDGGCTVNPCELTTEAITPDISLSFDDIERKAYVIYTTRETENSGLKFASRPIRRPTAKIEAVPSALAFGNVNVGSISDRTVTVSNTGGSPVTLGTISVTTGAAFARNGSTCSTTLNAGANCTVIVRFTPTSAGSFSDSLYIPSSLNNLTVPLSGTGVVQTSSSVDLIIPYIFHNSIGHNNQPFSVTVRVKNQGSSDAGPFNVKGYFSLDRNVSSSDKLLFTLPITGLSAGQQVSNTISNLTFSGATPHYYYYIIAVADADGQVSESNEANNNITTSVYISR